MRIAAGLLLVLAAPAAAGVTVTVDRNDHLVQGTTASGLVRSMHANPLQGDHGDAYASIHPSFSLSVNTTQRGGLCRADVTVRLSLRLTLPKAASPGAMNGRTRSAWNGFVAFAQRHEAHHQASYIACAKSFAARAARQTGKQCMALQSDIRKMFSQMKRDCEATQRAYDRSQARVLPGLALFSMARIQRRGR